MSYADALTLAGGIALAICVAAYVATALFRINRPEEQSDDQRIDTIRDELDSQEMRTRRVRGLS